MLTFVGFLATNMSSGTTRYSAQVPSLSVGGVKTNPKTSSPTE